MEFLSEVSFFVWDTVASVANMTPEELQTKSMDAAHISVGFVHKHLLAVYDALPWSLLQGDIRANLDKFCAGLEPAEKTASKIWIVITSGCRSRRECVIALELAADLPGTTRTAESQHSRFACIKRQHPDLEVVSLMSRGCIGQLNLLMPSMTDEEKVLRKQEQRMTMLFRYKKRSRFW